MNFLFIYSCVGLTVCSGLQTKGHAACPNCGPELDFRTSPFLNKTIYTGYRRFLDMDHPWRTRKMKLFNGENELRAPPQRPNGNFWVQQWQKVQKEGLPIKSAGMSRLSAFYLLPYWKVYKNPHSQPT